MHPENGIKGAMCNLEKNNENTGDGKCKAKNYGSIGS